MSKNWLNCWVLFKLKHYFISTTMVHPGIVIGKILDENERSDVFMTKSFWGISGVIDLRFAMGIIQNVSDLI